jgi:uridylate kinase
MRTKTFVIALGGSVVAPNKVSSLENPADLIDTVFLRRFYVFVKKQLKQGCRFVLVIGGGVVCRIYQNAAAKITKVVNEDKDWLGIHVTRLNAHLIGTIFRKEAHPVIFEERFKLKGFARKPIIVAAGWRPGWSTDFVACQIACDFGLKEVLILGKPDYVYTADFEKDPSAKPLTEISWSGYLKLVPKKWTPGLHSPVDPVAARLAQKEGLRVIIAQGRDLKNLANILRGQKFKGTIIER